MDISHTAEMGIASHFSFLQGASHPEELVVRAAKFGYSHMGLADRNTVAGVVRAHMAAKETDISYHPGARLVFSDETPDILAYPKNRKGWAHLCRLLSCGNLRAEKGSCEIYLDDLLTWGADIMLCLLPRSDFLQGDIDAFEDILKQIKQYFPTQIYLGLVPHYDGQDMVRFAWLDDISNVQNIPLMATNDVYFHDVERHALGDILSSIEGHQPVHKMGYGLSVHAERHMKTPHDMAQLLKSYPQALEHAVQFADQLTFSLDELRYQYPDEAFGDETPQDTLRRLTYEGAKSRYPNGIPDKAQTQIEYELALIAELEYEPYFLTVWDIVRYARSKNILCQGRGSAANSTVCYCLGITEVNPLLTDLLFERFISPERREPPDIDVDFEHERREIVIQYIYEKYGRHHAGLACTVVTYRARMAAREVGKAFGLSDDVISALSGLVWGWSSKSLTQKDAREAGLDINDPTTRRVLDYASVLIGFPRHLSQHVGGFVITKDRLDEVVPIMNTAMEGRTMVEWDKDDLDSLGILKIDILALGMLSCLSKCFDYLREHYDRDLTLATLPSEDKFTYDMISNADTIGVFQIESRAQMSMLPRLRPKEFYDLVIEVAIVRPGPIQGDMVHPYLRRRQGLEDVTYPSKELESVLKRTKGVPLFQEQAMKIAIVAAGFTPGEADKLRRAMATFRRVGTIHMFRIKMIEGMAKKGYDRDFAERCFKQIEGFGEYGFPESHAASFALLVYASCWLKAYYPDVFCTALLNSQPMGFYAPAQLIRDAREHGVQVQPIDINFSCWDNRLENGDFDIATMSKTRRHMGENIRTQKSIRLGFRQIKGLKQDDINRLVACRGDGYDSVRDVWLRAKLSSHAIERLAEGDCFRSLGLDRRAALWAAQALNSESAYDLTRNDDTLSLFHVSQAQGRDVLCPDISGDEDEMDLPTMRLGEQVINDYRYLRLSLKAHPVGFIRHELKKLYVTPHEILPDIHNGRKLQVAGLVLVRQRPGSAKGVIFLTLEDETGIANVVVWPKVFERYRRLILGSRLLRVKGKLQSSQGVIHIVAEQIFDMSEALTELERSDVVMSGSKPPSRTLSQVKKVLPKGRNFH